MKLKINIGASSIIAVILLLNLVFHNQITSVLVAYLPWWFIIQAILALIFIILITVVCSNIETAYILSSNNSLKQETKDYVKTVCNNRTRYIVIQCIVIILLTLNKQLLSLLLYSFNVFLLYIVDSMVYNIYKEMEE